MFTEIFENYDFRTESEKIKNRTIEDVEQALSNALQGRMLFDDYLSLLSPSADRLLTEMAELARRITRQRFGNIMQIYMPLYLSNECRSSCLYCGYSFENKLPRITLAKAELTREAEIIHSKGIRQVLALTGEDYSRTPVSYIADSVSLLNSYFPSVSIEIYPMDTDNYSTIINAGAEG
ncbi:MAG TPA: 2-iminoacetate synthase ThiH, partial [Leptospiraceae bacterium]|nr:2-iminoacetate synthase ThiH [Leptospiraceae bacterium]